MAGPRKLPDVPTLVRLHEQGRIDDRGQVHFDGEGLTHGEIASLYEVSRQAVTLKLKGATQPRMWRRDWPWEVDTRHKAGWLYDGLSFYIVDKKKERVLGERQKYRLGAFLESIKKLERRTGKPYVVDYDRETPVGFYFRPRKEEDPEDSIMGASA